MRIAFCASVALATIACTDAQNDTAPASTAPITVSARTERVATRFDLQTANGKRYVFTATRDATVSPDAQPTLQVVGEVGETAVVLVDTYPSTPGGLSFCQAGEERFLRVIALTEGRGEETLRLKVASCRDDVELGTRGIEWLPESSTVRIDWLVGPTSGTPEVRTIHIDRDGKPDPAAG